MDKNISLRLEGWIEGDERDFLTGCLSLCYNNGDDVVKGANLGAALF